MVKIQRSRLLLPVARAGVRTAFRYFSSSRKCDARAFVALGSNVGDRLINIETACRLIDRLPQTKLLRTSGLYETKAMYVVDQDPFLNGACEIDTDLKPLELLDQLQRIELQLKRKKVIDKGPRTLDLDILLYDKQRIDHERLRIPHPLMLERDFVLRPLCDLIPEQTHPLDSKDSRELSYSSYAKRLPETTELSEQPASLTVLAPSFILTSAASGVKPLIMGILNLTPDSFSDGGVHSVSDQEQMRYTLKSMIASGASIIDVGGESTRPGSKAVRAEEEIRRILPTVNLAAQICKDHKSIVSIDTYRAAVADAALSAGAHMINDISAGTLDPDMFSVVAKHNASIILMHTRGTPQSMFADPAFLDYGPDLVATVASELVTRVNAAQAAGVPRWRILVDPGFGFAKTYEQNIELLQRLDELRNAPGLKGLPWVIGISRKRFVRGLAGYNPATHRTEEDVRTFADRGTVMALKEAVKVGSEVLRVHDIALVKRLLETGT